jgi:N-acetylated-alpha-linked acidic dipeptidase
VAEPKNPFVAPRREPPVPHFDLSPLQNASDALTTAAAAYTRAFDAAFAAGAAPIDPARRKALNAVLRDFERSLTSEKGLPGRPWYRHLVYAPGAYTGYGVKTLPAVREALEQKRWDDVNPAAVETGAAIEKAAAQVREATKLLGS